MKEKRKQVPTAVIGGYYGYGSIGDEAMLESIISSLEERMPEGQVFVINRDKYLKKRRGDVQVSAIPRKAVLSLVYRLIKADVFIFGGGSLLQDKTSLRSLFYYKALLHLASLLGCKIYIYANGIGPVSSPHKLRSTLRLADEISVRDRASLSFCQRILGEEDSRARITSDPVLAAFPVPIKEKALSCLRSLGGKKYFAVSLRECRGKRQVDIHTVAAAVNRIRRDGSVPVFVPMQREYDLEICRQAAHLTEGVVADCRDLEGVLQVVSGAEVCIGMRLHFLLAAVMAGVPCVALSYDRKVRDSMDYLGVYGTLDAFSLTQDQLFYATLAARHCTDREKTRDRCLGLSALAREDADRLADLLREGKKRKKEEKATQVSG